MIFYTADPHFGYEPTLVWRPGFSSVEEMDEALIAAWNAVVTDDDTVYLIGDVGWNDGHVPCRTLARLKGRKHLIRGNHDTGFVDAPLLYRYFESVTDFWELEDGDKHIILSHYPILYNKRGYMIHGHLHGSGQFQEVLKDFPKVLNAGVDLNGWAPVTLEQLIANNERFYATPVVQEYRPRQGKGLLPVIPDFHPVPLKPQPHPRHLFLTGRKQVGKSTVLRALLAGRDAHIGGFRTQRIRTEEGADIFMLAPTGEPDYKEENILFRRREGRTIMTDNAFDRLGDFLLKSLPGADLVLMDELGPNEAKAFGFQRAVEQALDGDAPVYGILQMADSEFLDRIAAREDVCVITVTEENRNDLPRLLLEQGW